MSTGYTRQATANISAGLTISAADLNAEYNQIQSAFDGTTGHDHSGGSGLGPRLAASGLSNGVTGTGAVVLAASPTLTGTLTAATVSATSYKVGATALAASHLSNGTTGTGAIMLAASPTTTGTLTAGAITSGAITASGTSTINALQLTTDLQVAHGGTGSSTASDAFNTIVVISQDVVGSGTQGYVRYTNTLVDQFGQIAFAGGSAAVTFTLAFPVACVSVVLTSNTSDDCWVSGVSATGFTVNSDFLGVQTVYWRAAGR